MKKAFPAALAALLLCGTPAAQALINTDRTRIIMNSTSRATSLGLENTQTDTPFLAQSWVDNEDGSRSRALIALPPLQRIDGGQKSQVRIMQIAEQTAALPQDRESLFYFSVLGVPPKAEIINVVQLAQQIRLKLFYRPAALGGKKDEPERALVVTRGHGGLRLENPTAYYISLVALGAQIGKNLENFDSVVIAPFSQKPLPGVTYGGSHLYVGYVDDYGGLKINRYHCTASRCAYTAADGSTGGHQ